MIQQEHFEKFSLHKLKSRNFAGFSQLGPGEMYRVPGGYPGGYPTGYPQGPRSLHFRGKRPIPRLQKSASSSARPAAALRDHEEVEGCAHKLHHVSCPLGSAPGRAALKKI